MRKNSFIPDPGHVPDRRPRGIKKHKPRASKFQALRMEYDMLERMYFDDLGFKPARETSVEVELPKRRGRKSNWKFGLALVREYNEGKAAGARRCVILNNLKEKAEKGRLKYFREKRVQSINAIWHAIRTYR